MLPTVEQFKGKYILSKRMIGTNVAEFDISNISRKWDDIMNGLDTSTGFKGKVIGNEKIKEEVISAILTGKHILLYGPPGTGKTMIASRISRAFDCDSKLYTANAEWSSDDTIGGYTLTLDSEGHDKLIPKNGCISEVIEDCNINLITKIYDSNFTFRGKWIIIDELNRAKMDFALGALFTALDKDYSILDLPQYGHVSKDKCEIYVPNSFKIIGTINNFDKNFLFKFSYALSRRFAHIYVGVPSETEFSDELNTILDGTVKYLNQKFEVSTLSAAGLNTDRGITRICELISLLRGYGTTGERIRDIGTSQVIDTIRIYCVHKFVLNASDNIDDNRSEQFADISINSVIIPSLEGVLDNNQLDVLKSRMIYAKKCLLSLENFRNLSF